MSAAALFGSPSVRRGRDGGGSLGDPDGCRSSCESEGGGELFAAMCQNPSDASIRQSGERTRTGSSTPLHWTGARPQLIQLEELDDDQLDALTREFERVRERRRRFTG
jgi:hypothetical protein